jgi:hypothetical protein
MIVSISKFSMKRFTQPWRPCRNIGIQHVGNAACLPRPEVVIAAREIPSQLLQRTFRGQHETCCRPTTPLRWPQLRRFLNLQHHRRKNRNKSNLETTLSLPRPNKCLNVVSWVTARHDLPQFPLPTGNSEELKNKKQNEKTNKFELCRSQYIKRNGRCELRPSSRSVQ